MTKYLPLLFCLSGFFGFQTSHAQLVFGSIEQRNVTSTSFEVRWTTNNNPGIAYLKYGLTPALELGAVTGTATGTQHQVTLSGLSPASFYYVRPCLIRAADTAQAATNNYYTTASTSGGQIRVFFNRTTNASLSQNGAVPEIVNNPTAIENELIEYINNAQSTIDVCVYNNDRNGIVTALKNAHNRGVRVRYLTGDDTNNDALDPAPPFNIGVINIGNPLMHNKFMVVDAENAANAVVWTGSMNWTNGNIFDDYNNVVVIQDQALARAYVKEFEEMWGGNTATFNSTMSKSGSNKTDNTPHRFYVNGTLVECYFSPSDNATNGIQRAIQSAGSSVLFSLLSFTNNTLGSALVTEQNGTTEVYGMIANEGDLGCELPTLQTAGANVVEDANLSGELHHKYAIIDVNYPNNDPQVVTGSHNWSDGAEDVNDENTLIIHRADIANMFYQEFAKRWCEVKGNSNCAITLPDVTGVETVQALEGVHIQVFPNPARGDVHYTITTKKMQPFRLSLYGVQGTLWETIQTDPIMGQHTGTIPLADKAAGLYFLVVEADGKAVTHAIVVE